MKQNELFKYLQKNKNNSIENKTMDDSSYKFIFIWNALEIRKFIYLFLFKSIGIKTKKFKES
jgi:hypothetical protein